MTDVDDKDLFIKVVELMENNNIRTNCALIYFIFKTNTVNLSIERRRSTSRLRSLIDGKRKTICEMDFFNDHVIYNLNSFKIYDNNFIDFLNNSVHYPCVLKESIKRLSNLELRFDSHPAYPYGFDAIIRFSKLDTVKLNFNYFIDQLKIIIEKDMFNILSKTEKEWFKLLYKKITGDDFDVNQKDIIELLDKYQILDKIQEY